MRAFHLALAVLTFACAAPASAAVTILASNVNLADGPFTFGVTPQDTFTLSFNAREQFDPSPVLVSTTGTAAVTTVFGEPSVFFTRANVVIGPSTFPGFASVPDATRAAFSATESDLGLRYTVDANNFFGYARFAGANLITVAFESSANAPIVAGSMPVMSAVPEPATWAFMLVGFGAVGYSMRRRGAYKVAATAQSRRAGLVRNRRPRTRTELALFVAPRRGPAALALLGRVELDPAPRQRFP